MNNLIIGLVTEFGETMKRNKNSAKKVVGGRYKARTCDPQLVRLVLYQLS